jgi:peptidoglycan/LPS O-acetylase OafA/YrhL
MKFTTVVLLLVLIGGVLSTHFSVRNSRTEKERFFSIRVSAFCWLLGILFIGALLFLPNKQRLLVIAPAAVATLSLGRLLRNARNRLREAPPRENIERMKRVN